MFHFFRPNAKNVEMCSISSNWRGGAQTSNRNETNWPNRGSVRRRARQKEGTSLVFTVLLDGRPPTRPPQSAGSPPPPRRSITAPDELGSNPKSIYCARSMDFSPEWMIQVGGSPMTGVTRGVSAGKKKHACALSFSLSGFERHSKQCFRKIRVAQASDTTHYT